MEEITVNAIGESETLLATGLAGIVYGLFAVQPVAVLAFTGPVLLFETIIYRVIAGYLAGNCRVHYTSLCICMYNV